ncbi:hypothetical protein C8R45DRAFT_480008 [Mycena sanguinolenta]|nr:hypothetical protein C8R45DRAFT_480008 [Mycena sanguinolenta]
MTYPLPQELVDQVIDFVAGDAWMPKFTLYSCALVCRFWLPRSRAHLFERCPRRLLWDNIPGFLNLLQSPHCTFRPHIRTIPFSSWAPHDHSFNEILFSADWRCLENVRALEIHIFVSREEEVVDPFCAEFFTTFPRVFKAFPAVASLELSCCIRNDQCLPLLDWISCFPALRELYIRDMPGIMPYPHPTASAMVPQGLRSLRLIAQSLGPVLPWLCTGGRMPNVDPITLKLHKLQSDHVEIVRAALKQLGRTVHHLEFSLDWQSQNTGVDPLTLFDLSLHPELKVLAILDPSFGYSKHFGPEQVLPLLTTLVAPNLERLRLDLNREMYQPADWMSIEALLCPARFPCLRSVMFASIYETEHEHRQVWAALPLLDARGWLELGPRDLE